MELDRFGSCTTRRGGPSLPLSSLCTDEPYPSFDAQLTAKQWAKWKPDLSKGIDASLINEQLLVVQCRSFGPQREPAGRSRSAMKQAVRAFSSNHFHYLAPATMLCCAVARQEQEEPTLHSLSMGTVCALRGFLRVPVVFVTSLLLSADPDLLFLESACVPEALRLIWQKGGASDGVAIVFNPFEAETGVPVDRTAATQPVVKPGCQAGAPEGRFPLRLAAAQN